MTAIEQVEAWLLARNPELETIAPDLDLIENRVIDSLSFTEFIIFLEELVGRELVLDEQSAVAFRTLAGIRDHVLGEQDDESVLQGR